MDVVVPNLSDTSWEFKWHVREYSDKKDTIHKQKVQYSLLSHAQKSNFSIAWLLHKGNTPDSCILALFLSASKTSFSSPTHFLRNYTITWITLEYFVILLEHFKWLLIVHFDPILKYSLSQLIKEYTNVKIKVNGWQGNASWKFTALAYSFVIFEFLKIKILLDAGLKNT